MTFCGGHSSAGMHFSEQLPPLCILCAFLCVQSMKLCGDVWIWEAKATSGTLPTLPQPGRSNRRRLFLETLWTSYKTHGCLRPRCCPCYGEAGIKVVCGAPEFSGMTENVLLLHHPYGLSSSGRGIRILLLNSILEDDLRRSQRSKLSVQSAETSVLLGVLTNTMLIPS